MDLRLLSDRVLAADPGLTRLQMAARATFSVATALVLLLLLCRAAHLPITVALLGAAICITWSIAVSDPGARDRRVTTLLMWLPAAAMVCAGTLMEFNRYLQDALFLAVLFAAVYVRRFGPRYNALGMMAVLAFFFALFLRAKAQTLPWLIAGITVAAACTYFYRFLVFRDRPNAALANAVQAFRARQRSIARELRRAAQLGRWTPAMRRRVQHHAYRLNEAAIVIGDLLGSQPEAHEQHAQLLETELETQATVERALRDPRAAIVMPVLSIDAGVRADRAWTPRGPYRAGTDVQTKFLTPAARQAMQLTAGATIALVAGELLSPQRWYWAVLTTFLVFTGVSSSGETIVKGWGRVAGTALGIAAGGGIAYLVRGSDTAALVLVFIFLFAGVYTLRLSYAVFTFFLTALLSMLYVLIGTFSDQLLLVRLVETIVGAVCGGIAALVLFPIGTHRVLASVSVEALERLSAAVEASLHRIEGKDDADPVRAVRSYDEALQSLRTQIEPLLGAGPLGGTERLRLRLELYAALGTYARSLAVAAYDGAAAEDGVEAVGEVVLGHIRALEDGMRDGTAGPQETIAKPSADRGALRELYRIDRAVGRLSSVESLNPGSAS